MNGEYKFIYDWMLDGCALHRENTCIVAGLVSFKFGDICDYIEKFSKHLKVNGITRGDHVVCLLENSVEYVVLYFSVIMAGGVFVPIDPASDQDKIDYIYSVTNAKFLFIRKSYGLSLKLKEKFTTYEISSAFLDEISLMSQKNIRKAEVACSSEDPALVLFTSGTTGAPKGVVLSHKNLLSNTISIISYLNLSTSDSIINILPFFYSYGNSVLLTHLFSGATVYIENEFFLMASYIERMHKIKPTGFSGVPTSFYLLKSKSSFFEERFDSLRYITQAGGKLRESVLIELRDSFPCTDLFIMYGQTEASARLSFLPPALVDLKPGAIGTGIPGVQLLVVDQSGLRVDVGEEGELIAKGDNVMQGYLGDPVATSEVLKGEWLYTGDLATYDADGFIYIVGRKSNFIKCAGYRINPHEVERVISELSFVEDVAVIGVAHEVLGEAVFACLEVKNDNFEPSLVVDHCKKNLPSYYVPQGVVCASIPRTASGKIRYGQLRSMFSG